MSTISPICGGWVSACLICESPWNCERFLWRAHVAWHRAVVFPRHLPIFNFGVDLGPTSQNWMLVLDQICLQRLKGKMCLSKCLLEVFLTSLIILSHIPPHQGPWKAICSGCLVQREFCGFSSLRIHFAVVVNADVLSGNIRCGLIFEWWTHLLSYETLLLFESLSLRDLLLLPLYMWISKRTPCLLQSC